MLAFFLSRQKGAYTAEEWLKMNRLGAIGLLVVSWVQSME